MDDKLGNICPARSLANIDKGIHFVAALPHESAHTPAGGDNLLNVSWRMSDGKWRRGSRLICRHCGSMYVEEILL